MDSEFAGQTACTIHSSKTRTQVSTSDWSAASKITAQDSIFNGAAEPVLFPFKEDILYRSARLETAMWSHSLSCFQQIVSGIARCWYAFIQPPI